MKKIKNFKGYLNEMDSPDLKSDYECPDCKLILSEEHHSSAHWLECPECGNTWKFAEIDKLKKVQESWSGYSEEDQKFVNRYESLNKAMVNMDADAFSVAEEWLDKNEDKYLQIITHKQTIQESTGDIQPQFVGNDYENVNVKQIEGGIELSSHSKTDIYNLKQIHGGEVIMEDGMYILYIKDKKN